MMLRPKELEKIRKKISVENDELDCLTAMCYMGTGKYSKANSMLEKIGKRTTPTEHSPSHRQAIGGRRIK